MHYDGYVSTSLTGQPIGPHFVDSKSDCQRSGSFGDFSFLGSSLNAVVVLNTKHAS